MYSYTIKHTITSVNSVQITLNLVLHIKIIIHVQFPYLLPMSSNKEVIEENSLIIGLDVE